MKKSIFWKALGIYCSILGGIVVVLIIALFIFLKSYQKTYDREHPSSKIGTLVEAWNTDDMTELEDKLAIPTLSEYESEEDYRTLVEACLEKKNFTYEKATGEYLETRPVYIIMSEGTPVAKVIYRKMEQNAKYKISMYELKEIQTFLQPKDPIEINAPQNVTVSVNGRNIAPVTDANMLLEHPKAHFFDGATTIDSICEYHIEGIYGDFDVKATDKDGKELPIKCADNVYEVAFGDEALVTEEQRKLAIEFAEKYTLVISNDLSSSSLKPYFPSGSQILKTINSANTNWVDAHDAPSLMNQQIRKVTYYNEEAFSAHVYLQETMYVPFSGKMVTNETNIEIYFVKSGQSYKVYGIDFQPK